MSRSSQDAEEHRQELKLAEAILEYLAEHPQATDTLEGIAKWWFLRQQIRVEVERVAKALDRLIATGYLESIGSGEKCHYRRKAPASESLR